MSSLGLTARRSREQAAARRNWRNIARVCRSVLVAAVLLVFGSHAAQAALTITKSVSDATPNVGQTITFTINVTSSSSDSGVVVSDKLPTGLTLLLSTPSQGAYDNTTGIWLVGTVNSGTPATLTLTARVEGPNQVTNTATITNPPGGGSASVTVTPQVADLSIAKSVANPTPNVGDTVTFTVTLSNSGPNPANGVTVQDSLSAGLTFVSASVSQGSFAAGTWTVGTVNNGTTATLTLQARVVSPDPQTNTATISNSNQFDPTTGNNSASVTVTPQRADLVIAKTAPAAAATGATFNYTITISNLGPDGATNVAAQDTLPPGVLLVSATASQGAFSGNTWTVGSIAASAVATLTLTVQKNTGATVTNTATISHSDQFDPSPGNNSATASTANSTQSPPTISKSFGASSVPVGGTTSLSFTIANPNGAASLTGVGFTDNLPAGLVVSTPNGLSGPCGGGTITATAGSGGISLSGATLGANSTCTFQVNVTGTTAGVKNNTTSAVTSIEGGNGNVATATLTVTGGNATSTTLVSSLNPSTVGQAVTFTATVTSSAGTPTGTVTFTDGATVLATVPLSGGTAAFTTSSLAAGTHTITASYGGSAGFAASTSPALTQTVNATQSPPTISKSFGASTIPIGGTTSLSFTIANPNGGAASLTGVGFTDNLPAGLVVATPNGLSGSCGGGTITAVAGSGGVSLSGATLAANSTCTFQVNVTGTTAGVKNNTTSAVTSIEGGNGNVATATLTVSGGNATSTTLVSSLNPSNVGQAVTFTATVTSSAGTPTGTVTFTDGATVLATVPLSGGTAAFTTSSLTVGTHTITASYGGSPGFAASTSPALTQTVQIPTDSARLRALQLAVTKVEAQASGAAFEGAVSAAIADGFSDGGGAVITPNGTGLRFNFGAEPDAAGRPDGGRVADPYDAVAAARAGVLRDSGAVNQNLPASVRGVAPDPSAAGTRVDDAFAALNYAGPPATKAPPRLLPPKEWLLWADVRGTGWNTDPSAGDIRGGQVNVLAGLTRKVTPDFLLGVLGGYENFDYTSQTLNGKLKGNGWTVGGYLGWRIWPSVRFDAAVGYSGIDYDGVSGMAAASFPGNRWIVSGGFTGLYRTSWLEIEPSAKVYAIWEHDNSYIDTLGTLQTENDFSTGRASGGVKLAYPMVWDSGATLAPYVGFYGDYYFSSDNAVLLLPTQFVHGWAGRATAGLGYSVAGGARILVGGEVGGLGSQNFTTWSVRGRASAPF